MSDPETIPSGVHPEVELLPWYANGTLGTTDRQRVTHHLESCQDCRRELDDLTRMMRSVQAVYREQPEPSTRLARSVMARVAAEPRARENQQMPWSAVIDGWFRSFFMPRWVPTLAAVLLIAQMSLLVWVALPPEQRSVVMTRSVGMQAPKLAVRFQPAATEEQIASLLQRLHARVIDGPTEEGVFTISLSTGDPAAALALLREQRDVIRAAELVKP